MQSHLILCPSGAGIGGLTFALALSRYTDIDIDIYESARALTEVGAGIGIFPRKSISNIIDDNIDCSYSGPWKIIKMLGLEADLLKVTETKVVDGPGKYMFAAPLDPPQMPFLVSAFRYRKSDQYEGIEFYTLITQGQCWKSIFFGVAYQITFVLS